MNTTNQPERDSHEVIDHGYACDRTAWWRTRVFLWMGSVSGLAILFILGCVVSYYMGRRTGGSGAPTAVAQEEAVRWTCSMHPQVDLPEPGQCPICFMDLIPRTDTQDGDESPRTLVMSPAAAALAEIETTPVKREFVTNMVRMVGKVDYAETKMAYITAWVPGRLDRLYIDYTGVSVRKGDHLVEMYSPDLVVAQQELIQAWNNFQRFGAERDDDLLQTTLTSTEEKLRLLGLTAEQIEEIKTRGKPSDQVTIYAPVGGVVVHKNANEGMYVQTGTRIYTIADLSQVWVFMDAYESDVPWLRYGQEVEFTTETYPGEIFAGRIAFIDPVLDEKTRTVRVRVNVPNENRRLKPGMFVRAAVMSRVALGGQVIDEVMADKWISPHHPEIVRDGPGKCPICGVDLVPAQELGFVTPDAAAEPPLVIPATAPLITGKRSVVYVRVPEKDEPTFEGREIALGPRAGDHYVVREGLQEGEEVVTRGNFKIDSALQIAAKPSMMSPEGSANDGSHHQHDHSHEQVKLIDVPNDFREAITPVYTSYLDVAKALADDDQAAAFNHLQQLGNAIAMVDAKTLDEIARTRWQELAGNINSATAKVSDEDTIETQRDAFHEVSNSVLSILRSFGQQLEQPLYEVFCPMAFDDQGAAWMQMSTEVANPYFGAKMLRCGEQRQVFSPIDAEAGQ